MCHIIGIKPQFENIIKNGPFIPMTAGQRKPKNQWTRDERTTANLDQRLKSLIMSVLPDDQMNFVINYLTAKSTWDDLILYHEGPSDVKESRVVDLKLCYNTFKFKEGKSLTQTFTRYKALMNELVNDGIKHSMLEINIGFINGLPKKWLSFCQCLINTNHVKDSELASLFGKLKYEENLTDSIYETEKNKSLVSTTPLSTTFFSSSIVQDFQDSPDDEKDTRSSTQRFSSTKATDQTECYKCDKKGHFTRDCWSKTSVSTSQSPFQTKPFSSPQHKHELRPTKDFEAKYNKVKAKLALLSSSASTSKTSMVKNKCLIAKSYEWDEEEVLSNDNEMVEVKVLLALAEENGDVSKESARNGEWVKILLWTPATQSFDTEEDNNDRKCISEQIPSQKKKILGVDQLTEDPSSFILPNHDTGRILPAEPQRSTIDPSVTFTDSSATNYDSVDESSVCSTPLPPLKKLEGAEPIYGPKTIKSILKSKSTLKTEALKGVIINEPSSAPAKGNKSSSASKVHSAHAGKLKSVKIKDDPSLAIDYLSKERSIQEILNMLSKDVKLVVVQIIPQLINMTLNGSKKVKHFKPKKAEALKSSRAESSNANRSKTPTKSRCLRHMIGVKSYLKKYMEQPGPKVVFGDDSTCTTEGYGSIKCNGIIFTKFDEKRGTIFNSNKEIVMITPLVRDVYVLDMTSSDQESCFFAKASEDLNWLWHKRLAHLNFKTINKLAKQNLVIGLPSLVYSKDKPCSSCEKGKHHRVSFKTKQTSSIKKCLHLLHMDLFGPVTPRSINHEKYTLVIVDEYSRNSTLVNFCEEKGISQNFSSPYTPKQHGFDERENRTLIEAARTMLSGSVFSKQYWTEAVATACYTQNRSTIVKRHLKTPYEIFLNNINIAESERYPPDEYLHPYEPSQRYQINSNDVSFIEPYECPKLVVLETKVSSDQNDEILNDDHSEHSNHTNDEQIIDNLPNIKDIHISEHLSSPNTEDTLVQNTIIPSPPLHVPSMITSAPQDRWSQDKYIELVNIIGNPGAGILTRAIAKQLSAASAHECLFLDFLSAEEPKKAFEALMHPG
ncbi:retrovirus-related pol polyprotein from transposon TNT 1-94 [Tanacetum coccineum]